MKIPKVLTIAGSDSGGGAGIQADLKAISALGGYGMSVITALTAQNTLGVQGIHEVPVDFVEQQFDSIMTDIGIDAAKTGMLSDSKIIRAVARKIHAYQIEKLVVDPVMVAKSGAMLLKEESKQALIDHLLPVAFVVTPNVHEAKVLAGINISTKEDMKEAARIIHQMGTKNVLVKGGHISGDAVDILYDGKQFHELVVERFDTQDTHGTGCTLSAAIATELSQGKGVLEAVKTAKEYITTAIRFALRLGGGHGPTNPFAALFREVERYRCLEDLKQAIQRLKDGHCGNIIPEVQSNLGYALPYAIQCTEVAAVPGRIVNVHGEVRTVADPEFGASRHIAKIILTVMQHTIEHRSAMNIRFSEEILRICRESGLAMSSFNRAEEPEDIKQQEGSSLEWGTRRVLSECNTVPDIIFDRGDVGKEPIVRFLGKTPSEVVDKVLHVSHRLKAL
jgi:hydroxymethylpyrimidine/phosphomethylpyrimidine kinase